MRRFLSSAAVFAGVFAVAVQARALEPAKPNQIVTAATERTANPQTCGGLSNVLAFNTRIMPDGTTAPFVIPAGQVLVVTSGEVWYFQETNSVGTSELGILSDSGFLGLGIISSALTDPFGYAHEFLSFRPGLVVKSGRSLCISNQGFTSLLATVNGFLTKDE